METNIINSLPSYLPTYVYLQYMMYLPTCVPTYPNSPAYLPSYLPYLAYLPTYLPTLPTSLPPSYLLTYPTYLPYLPTLPTYLPTLPYPTYLPTIFICTYFLYPFISIATPQSCDHHHHHQQLTQLTEMPST